MNKRNLMMLCLFACSLKAIAQDAAEKTKPAFHAVGSVGLLEGDKSSSFQLQLLNGFEYKTWYGAIGTGLDYYFMRSIPLTGYLEKQVSQRLPFFLYGSGGVHFIWRRDLPDEGGWYNSDYNQGLYYDAGFGYRFMLAKNAAIRLSVGFSEKQVEETRTWQNFIWGQPAQTQKEIYDYRLKRLSIRGGFRF